MLVECRSVGLFDWNSATVHNMGVVRSNVFHDECVGERDDSEIVAATAHVRHVGGRHVPVAPNPINIMCCCLTRNYSHVNHVNVVIIARE